MNDARHLSSLHIQRFRGLEDIKLEGLGAFNLLVGANDVGKTSVLEGAFLLTGFANPELPIRVQNLRKLVVAEFDDLALLFHRLDTSRPIRMSADSDGSVTRRALHISCPPADEELEGTAQQAGTNGEHAGSGVRGMGAASSLPRLPAAQRLDYRSKVERSNGKSSSLDGAIHVEQGQFRLSRPPGIAEQQPLSATFMASEPGLGADAVSEVLVHKKADMLIQFLRVINPLVAGLTVRGDVVHVDVGLDRMLPINLFGGGMKRAADILANCILNKQQILLIDELENGLHHAAVRPFLEMLLGLSRDQGLQVFATTHSLGVLQSLRESLADERFGAQRDAVMVYTLQRDFDGQVRAYAHDYLQFEHCIASGFEIR